MARRHHASRRREDRREYHESDRRSDRGGRDRHSDYRMDLGHREYTGTMMKRMARYPKEDGMPEEAPMPNVVHGGYRMRDREQYAGREESKMLMARDGAMIHEDWNQAALLPSRVIDRDWPRAHNYHMGMVESLFTAANHQLEDDYEDLGRELKPGKY